MKPAFVGLAFGVGISLCASRARAAECERIEAADVDRALAAESSDVSTKHITLRTESGNLLACARSASDSS